MFVFQSCTKSDNPPPNPEIPKNLVTSFTRYNAEFDGLSTDTLIYDEKNNLVKISVKNISWISGTAPAYDSGTYYFTIDPNTYLPSAYTLRFRKYFYETDEVAVHRLTYDNENRLVLDSTLSDSMEGYAPKGDHYSYSDQTIFVRNYWPGSSDFKDSLLISNGNFVHRSTYRLDDSEWKLYGSYENSIYSDYPNPFYYESLSKSLGAFSIINNLTDFLSKNLSVNIAPGKNYVWVTDSIGRVISGTAADSSYMKFTYQR